MAAARWHHGDGNSHPYPSLHCPPGRSPLRFVGLPPDLQCAPLAPPAVNRKHCGIVAVLTLHGAWIHLAHQSHPGSIVWRFARSYVGPRTKGPVCASSCFIARNALHEWAFAIDALGTALPEWSARVFLILDNLRVHHSKAVKKWLAENQTPSALCAASRSSLSGSKDISGRKTSAMPPRSNASGPDQSGRRECGEACSLDRHLPDMDGGGFVAPQLLGVADMVSRSVPPRINSSCVNHARV